MKAIGLFARTLGWLIALLALIVAGYFLAAWIGSSIPRNADWTEAETGIPIMIEDNGYHTGIVMPLVTPVKDWRTTFPSTAEPMPGGRLPTHISVGWGDREVYRTVATWDDLKPGTVLRIATSGGPAVIRIAGYYRPAAGPHRRWLILRDEEYARLVAQVEKGLPPVADPNERHSYSSFDPRAKVYDGAGRYWIGYTCNQWVSDALAEAGVKTGLWTPLSGGVMKWIRQEETRR